MAIIHFVNYHGGQSDRAVEAVLEYIMREAKTVEDGQKYVTGINCCPESAVTEFRNTKRLYRKEDGMQFFHLVQSFPPWEQITPKEAHQIALEFAEKCEKLSGFEVVAATHRDREHIHTHFIINSVNSETGKKFHIGQREVEQMMQLSDSIVKAHGYSVLVPDPDKQCSHLSDREYRCARKGDSWKFQLAVDISRAMEIADSQETFVLLMELEDYHLTWTPERKNITYTCPNGKKCRDNKLHFEKYLKENMEHEFRIRQAYLAGNDFPSQERNTDRRKNSALRQRDGTELGGSDWGTPEAYPASGDGTDPSGTADNKGTDGKFYEPAAGFSAGGRTKECRGDQRFAEEAAAADRGYVQGADTDAGEFGCTGWEDERSVWLRSHRRTAEDAEVYGANLLDLSHPHGTVSALGGAARLAADIGSAVREEEDPEERRRRIEAEEGAANLGAVLGVTAGIAMDMAAKNSGREEVLVSPETEESVKQNM